MLGVILRAQDRHEEARGSSAHAVAILSHAFNSEHPSVSAARLDLGTTLTQLGRFAEAEQELLAVHASLSGSDDNAENTLAECTNAIVKMYEAWDQAEPDKLHDAQARRWAAKIRGDDAQMQLGEMNGG